jgi:hypothetical protein
MCFWFGVSAISGVDLKARVILKQVKALSGEPRSKRQCRYREKLGFIGLPCWLELGMGPCYLVDSGGYIFSCDPA